MSEFPAGSNLRFVTYYSNDDGGDVDLDAFAAGLAASAEAEIADGWRVLSTSVLPLRQLGTAGNVFFQSGGQFATMLGALVVYARGRRPTGSKHAEPTASRYGR